MSTTHPPYTPKIRRQMVDLVRSGRSGGGLSNPGRRPGLRTGGGRVDVAPSDAEASGVVCVRRWFPLHTEPVDCTGFRSEEGGRGSPDPYRPIRIAMVR